MYWRDFYEFRFYCCKKKIQEITGRLDIEDKKTIKEFFITILEPPYAPLKMILLMRRESQHSLDEVLTQVVNIFQLLGDEYAVIEMAKDHAAYEVSRSLSGSFIF